MKKLIILFLSLTGMIYSQWNVQYSFNPSQSLQAIRFYDANTGYTCAPVYTGGSTLEIHKTTNAGVNWVDQNAGYTGTRLMSIYILHPDTVYISGNEGLILKTVNGGNNWVTINSEPALQLWGIHFVNSFTGFTCGGGSRIMKTTNAGVNWFNQTSPVLAALSAVYFINETTGFICGSTVALKTTNAGANWINMNAPFVNFETFRDIYFFNENSGLYVSDLGRIGITTNSGTNWNLANSGTTQTLMGVKFNDAMTGYACGYAGVIIRTTDGGNNWSPQTSPLNEILTDVWFTSANTGYICSWTGKVLKTTNGGMVPVTPISSEIPKEFNLGQNYPNPFNPTTSFKLQVSSYELIKVSVYDILGNEVQTLVNEELKPGVYEVTFNAADHSSGVYYYKLIAGGLSDTKKMVLVR